MSQIAPDPSWLEYQQRMNDENLRTLAVLHRVFAGLCLVATCCLGGWVALMLGIFGAAASSDRNGAPPAIIGGLMAVAWGSVFICLGGVAVLNWLCANWISGRRNWTGVIVVAALDCLNVPLGAALGVFTLIVV